MYYRFNELENIIRKGRNMLTFGNTFINSQKHELLDYVTEKFPVACYFDDLNQKFNPWHWHEEFEVGIVRENPVMIRTPDGERCLNRGDCFFINSGVLHSIQNTGPDKCFVDGLVFHGRLPGGDMDSIFWENYILPVQLDPALSFIIFDSVHQKSAADLISSAWMECVRNDDGFENTVRFLLTKLFLMIHQEHLETIPQRNKKETVNVERSKTMLGYIKEHFPEEITLQDIADSASVSRSECIRCFRTVLKTSPVTYLNKYRLQYAAGLLSSTSWKISYICQQCGFHEVGYFSKSFKKIYGCSPSEYRASSLK